MVATEIIDRGVKKIRSLAAKGRVGVVSFAALVIASNSLKNAVMGAVTNAPRRLKLFGTVTSKWEKGGDTMMIKVLVVAVTLLGFSALGFAQAKPATPATPATPAAPSEKKTEAKSDKAKTNRITGEVASVDPKAGTLAVKTKDKEVNLTAESKSAKAALEKVKPGDKVKVSYTEKDGKMIATSVTAESKTTASKSDKPTPKKSETK